ncbi:DUF5681 domain-containing protein [Hyphomonas sp.]|uniref:DUF5681 domain-containing protein n=1 Tax=Alphaproteobacteria TaxID=28211 RepID=UPI0032679C27
MTDPKSFRPNDQGEATEPAEDVEYGVGYGRPPLHSRWKKGESGNRSGRAKGVSNLSTDVKKTLKLPVTVVVGGKKRTQSTQRGVLLKIREKALKGDARALDLLVQLSSRYNDEAPQPLADRPISSDDEAIVADFLARHGNGSAERKPGSGPTVSRPKATRRRRHTKPPVEE